MLVQVYLALNKETEETVVVKKIWCFGNKERKAAEKEACIDVTTTTQYHHHHHHRISFLFSSTCARPCSTPTSSRCTPALLRATMCVTVNDGGDGDGDSDGDVQDRDAICIEMKYYESGDLFKIIKQRQPKLKYFTEAEVSSPSPKTIIIHHHRHIINIIIITTCE